MPRYRSQRGSVYSREERRTLIVRYVLALEQRRLAEEISDGVAAANCAEVMSDAVADYVAATPIVALSRSPISGAVFETSLDLFGIDGLWWSYDHDHRPFVEPPDDFFAWTGSMHLDGPIPASPIKAMVGPEAPFVLPRLLDQPSISAVISSVQIGDHVGFPVAYFSSDPPLEIERVNDWGHNHYSAVRPDGSPFTARAIEVDEDKDFELLPWIDTGKLSWIAPGDIELNLVDRTAGCPYIGLGGGRHRQYIQNGRRWTADVG